MTHLQTARNPMSEARRQHVHGKLRTLAQQAKDEGEPSWFVGSALVLFIILIGIATAVVLNFATGG